MAGEMRRVNVTLLVKALSQKQAEELARGRMNEWFTDPRCDIDPREQAFPIGTLLHYTVEAQTGHRAVV